MRAIGALVRYGVRGRRTFVAFLMIAMIALPLSPPASAQDEVIERWHLTPSLSIGRIEGGRDVLTHVSDVAVDADGMLYVAQPMDGSVWVFDRSGEFVEKIGRRGAGPAEFIAPQRLGWHGGQLYVFDFRGRRLTLLDPEGKEGESWGLLTHAFREPFKMAAVPGAVLADGALLLRPRFSARRQREVGQLPLLRFAADGEYAGVLARLDWSEPPLAMATVPGRSGNTGFVFVQRPVSYESMWDLAPDGSSVTVIHRPRPAGADSGRFTVLRVSTQGDTIIDRSYHYAPVTIPEETWQSVAVVEREGRLEFFSKLPFDRTALAEALADIYQRQPYQVAADTVIAATDDSIWIRRGSFGLEQAKWLVLDRRGRITATFNLPTEVRLLHAAPEVAWGVVKDELDVQHLVRYQVIK